MNIERIAIIGGGPSGSAVAKYVAILFVTTAVMREVDYIPYRISVLTRLLGTLRQKTISKSSISLNNDLPLEAYGITRSSLQLEQLRSLRQALSSRWKNQSGM